MFNLLKSVLKSKALVDMERQSDVTLENCHFIINLLIENR